MTELIIGLAMGEALLTDDLVVKAAQIKASVCGGCDRVFQFGLDGEKFAMEH
ncbi:MAG: hypothetical protein M0Z36_07280 [Thermaerobacter sp.]|nr:hypothetical protein [Thermaerobacter sp.]